MRGRILGAALACALAFALLGGAIAYAAHDKRVTLVVGGQARTVHVLADTVDDVLTAEGIRTGPHDVVAPDRAADVSDGTRIAVRFGRQLTLTVDGHRSTHWVTAGNLGDALAQLGLRFRGADLSASRSVGIERSGLAVRVRTLKHLTIRAGHTSREVESTALTVGEALADAGITVRGPDRVRPALDAPVEDGATITVTRVDVRKRRIEIEIPYRTVRRADSSMLAGHSAVDRAGRPGVRVRVLRVTYVNGRKVSRRLVDEKVRREPVSRILRYGTRQPAPPPASRTTGGGSTGGGNVGGGVDSLNWSALAQCESGGDPRAVSPDGSYYGLYQFSLSTWQSVGGSGNPIDHSAAEQTYRAKILYRRTGADSWPVCGSRLYS